MADDEASDGYAGQDSLLQVIGVWEMVRGIECVRGSSNKERYNGHAGSGGFIVDCFLCTIHFQQLVLSTDRISRHKQCTF